MHICIARIPSDKYNHSMIQYLLFHRMLLHIFVQIYFLQDKEIHNCKEIYKSHYRIYIYDSKRIIHHTNQRCEYNRYKIQEHVKRL